MPSRVENAPLDLVGARLRRASSRRSCETLPLDEWAGPVPSAFGLHLVRLSARTPAALPAAGRGARSAVAREWENERRDAGARRELQAPARGVRVVIEADLPAAAATR